MSKQDCYDGGALRQGAYFAPADMYGMNLTFKTGGVDVCDCEETLNLIGGQT